MNFALLLKGHMGFWSMTQKETNRMKNISHYFKIFISSLLKTITGIMMGIGASFGVGPMDVEKKDNKTIETKK